MFQPTVVCLNIPRVFFRILCNVCYASSMNHQVASLCKVANAEKRMVPTAYFRMNLSSPDGISSSDT